MNTRLVEFRALVRLGLPLMAAQIFQMGQGFVDAVMAGRLSSADLAGITLGGSLMFPTMMLLSGILMAATPIIAQLNGAGRVPEVGEIVRQGLWLALAAATALVLFLWNAGPIYGWIGVDPLAAAIAVPYIRASCVGIPAIMCFFLFRYLCEGLGRTMPAMVIAGCALPLKVVLNYAFIYGELGAPELGGAGCGWSGAIVAWFELACIAFVVTRRFYGRANVFSSFSLPRTLARHFQVHPHRASHRRDALLRDRSLFDHYAADRTARREGGGCPSDCSQLQRRDVHDSPEPRNGRRDSCGLQRRGK